MIYRPLWAEINLRALRTNFLAIKKCVGNEVGIIATVKQNAYGHGLVAAAKVLDKLGAVFFAVESIEEAIVLRQNKITRPILILTAVLPQFAFAFIKYKLIPTIVDIDFALALNRAALNKKTIVPIHVKIDTGMGRLGIYYTEAGAFIEQLRGLPGIKLEGVYTHFSCADTDKQYTQQQINLFNRLVEQLSKQGIIFKYRHCANSAGLINYPASWFNLVRPGLVLYGINPQGPGKLQVEPVMALKTKVVFIKTITKGMSVSYGRTYIAKKNTRIATIAVGYADGYQRALSNKAKVIINNKIFPVVGRICMDHTMVDVGSNSHIKVGDEVILIGSSGKKQVTAQTLADLAQTIPYEITTCLSSRVPRVFRNILAVDCNRKCDSENSGK
jgi:alanine racemase